MKVSIPSKEAAGFAKQLGSDTYRKDERDYKVAVHLVLSALLSEENVRRDDFPSLISDVFQQPLPNLSALGILQKDQKFIKDILTPFGSGGLRSAMANLAGGKWGLAQFSWLPRAIEFDLGELVADAFRRLVDESVPLPQRVETFRDDLDVVSEELKRKGGYLKNWFGFRTSVAFVALLLTGYGPDRYTFYSKGALRFGYERYAPDISWPKGTMGDIYEDVCKFVKSVAGELKKQKVPVKDLIDAQSFIWLKYKESKNASLLLRKCQKPLIEEPDLESVAKDLAQAAFWSADKAKYLINMVQSWGQLLFQGPPGTGKTFVAETMARLLAGDEEGRVQVVQFHPSYAYEDFVEGIRPVLSEGSKLAYEIRKGIFMKLVQQAREYPEDSFFLVVDEINRANLPRVFGELLYALEYRGSEHTFRLPYSGTEDYIPDNITIIATMNSADRSIALVDAAIRRRFRHVDFEPDYMVLKAWMRANGLAGHADNAADRLKTLNAELNEIVGKDRLIGHTYLMRKDLADVGFESVWAEDIEPILREHLFNQPEEQSKLRKIFLS